MVIGQPNFCQLSDVGFAEYVDKTRYLFAKKWDELLPILVFAKWFG